MKAGAMMSHRLRAETKTMPARKSNIQVSCSNKLTIAESKIAGLLARDFILKAQYPCNNAPKVRSITPATSISLGKIVAFSIMEVNR